MDLIQITIFIKYYEYIDETLEKGLISNHPWNQLLYKTA